MKHRSRLPFHATWRKVKENAAREGKTPILVLHRKNTRDLIAVVDARWLANLLRRLEE